MIYPLTLRKNTYTQVNTQTQINGSLSYENKNIHVRVSEIYLHRAIKKSYLHLFIHTFYFLLLSLTEIPIYDLKISTILHFYLMIHIYRLSFNLFLQITAIFRHWPFTLTLAPFSSCFLLPANPHFYVKFQLLFIFSFLILRISCFLSSPIINHSPPQNSSFGASQDLQAIFKMCYLFYCLQW